MVSLVEPVFQLLPVANSEIKYTLSPIQYGASGVTVTETASPESKNSISKLSDASVLQPSALIEL